MKGAKVRGAYQVIAPCGIVNAQNGFFGDVCFQGTLRIQGHGHHYIRKSGFTSSQGSCRQYSCRRDR
jgi:hypothetical protein